MAEMIERITEFCAGRYNALSRNQPEQAKAYQAIINQITELRLSSEHPADDLLDWMSQPHTDADLTRACKLVFEMLGE